MADVDTLLTRLRRELGDYGSPFQSSVVGDGVTTLFDLPVGMIDDTTFQAYVVAAPPRTTPYEEQAPGPPRTSGNTTPLTSPADYTLDSRNGVIILTTALADQATLVVTGTSHKLFTNDELTDALSDAFHQMTHGRTVQDRYYDSTTGFVRYGHMPMTYANLPQVEEYPLVLLAAVEALWTLSTETSFDIDAETATGTAIPRTQRFRQIREQIEALQERFNFFARNLNIGLDRIEVMTLRRVSRTTGRYVPIYVNKEYDDYSPPQRILPPVDQRPVVRPTEVAEYDAELQGGRPYQLGVTLPIDGTGQTFRALLFPSNDVTTPSLGEFTVTVGTITPAGANTAATTQLTLSLTATQTSSLPQNVYYVLYSQATTSDPWYAQLQGAILVASDLVPPSMSIVPVIQTIHLPGETAQNRFLSDPDPYLYTGLPSAPP